MVYAAKRGKNRCPTHPGALLRDDIIPATGRTKAEIAGLLGISRQHLYDILRERKPVSPGIAVRLGKLFGDGAGIWTRRLLTIAGMRSEPKTSVIFPPSGQRLLESKRLAPLRLHGFAAR
jgi:addiction module HigA family antidote